MIFLALLTIFLINSLLTVILKTDKRYTFCGLAAFSGKSNMNPEYLKFLLYYNSIERKSEDSTGFWSPLNDLNKDAITAKQFLAQSDICPDKIFMGHVRSKTKGTSTKQSAHPFKVNNIIGMHNGTISNANIITKDRNIKEITNLPDSYAIVQCLAHDGHPGVFRDINGPAAFIFTDTSQSTLPLYVYRNNERPLWYGFLPEGMYISSEEASLKILQCKDITSFKAGFFYTILEGAITEEYALVDIVSTDIDKSVKFICSESEAIVEQWVQLKKPITVVDEYAKPLELEKNSWIHVIDYKQNTRENGEKEIIYICVTNPEELAFSFEVSEKDIQVPIIRNMVYNTPLIAVYDITGNKIHVDGLYCSANDLLFSEGVPFTLSGQTSKNIRVANKKNKSDFSLNILYIRHLTEEEYKKYGIALPVNKVVEEDHIAQKVFNRYENDSDKISALSTLFLNESFKNIDSVITDIQIKESSDTLIKKVELLKSSITKFFNVYKNISKKSKIKSNT